MRVFTGERTLEELSAEGWTYDEERNAVVLQRSSSLEPETRVSVRYRTRAS